MSGCSELHRISLLVLNTNATLPSLAIYSHQYPVLEVENLFWGYSPVEDHWVGEGMGRGGHPPGV